MDKEVLRLFGLLEAEGEEYREKKEYVPGIYINGRKILKRWTVVASVTNVLDRVNKIRVPAMRMLIQDEMTGRPRARLVGIERIWQDLEDKSVHIETESRAFLTGDSFDFYHQTPRQMEIEREIYLLNAQGSMGDHAFRLKEIEEEARR